MAAEFIKILEARGTDEVTQRITELDNLDFLYRIEKTRNLPYVEGGLPKPNFVIYVYAERS